MEGGWHESCAGQVGMVGCTPKVTVGFSDCGGGNELSKRMRSTATLPACEGVPPTTALTRSSRYKRESAFLAASPFAIVWSETTQMSDSFSAKC